MDYREIYCSTINQLGETYGTPAYAAAREDYLKLVGELAAADIRIFEDHRPDPDDPDYTVNEQILADLAQEIEVLRRVGYRFTNAWEENYQKLKAKFHS